MYKLHALQIIFKKCLIELCVFCVRYIDRAGLAGSSGRGGPGHQGGPGWVTNQPNQSGPGHPPTQPERAGSPTNPTRAGRVTRGH